MFEGVIPVPSVSDGVVDGCVVFPNPKEDEGAVADTVPNGELAAG